jgi:phosphopantothenoylcysteine decarboxylase/phosphopantothenate--cysteine ligase
MYSKETIPLLEGRHILLGVTGSIAAFKGADLASKLTQAGAKVDVILTGAGERFVTPLTFQALTGRRAYVQADLWGDESHILHVGLAESADLLVIAPATADTVAQLAHGRADTLLTLTALAVRCPMIVAPAMDVGMYEAAATQENLQTLIGRGVVQVGPVEGRMASGLVGLGRMVEAAELLGHIRLVMGREGPLQGRKVVVTAGGTQEPVDPVRSLTNRSSGKQGYALAQAALDRGASVTLVSAATSLAAPIGAGVIEVMTTADMKEATVTAAEEANVLLMAAAVADFRPANTEAQKIKRRKGVPEIVLEPTEDILAEVARLRKKSGNPEVVVGFAAESQDLVKNARTKLEQKDLSLIIANDITADDAGFSVDTNQVTLISPDGDPEELPLMSKARVAEAVLDRVVDLLAVTRAD